MVTVKVSTCFQAKNVEAIKSRESTASQLSDALRETQSLRANLEAKESKLDDTEKSREAATSRAEALQNENCDLKASLERQSNQVCQLLLETFLSHRISGIYLTNKIEYTLQSFDEWLLTIG